MAGTDRLDWCRAIICRCCEELLRGEVGAWQASQRLWMLLMLDSFLLKVCCVRL